MHRRITEERSLHIASLFICLILLCLGFIVSACNVEKKIPQVMYETYKTELMENSFVKKVKLSFIRPQLTIEAYVSSIVTDEDTGIVLDATKTFVTVDKMTDIAEYAKGGNPILYVSLKIFDNDGLLLKEYMARYFKTSQASDFSPENIDGYKTWREVTNN